MPSLDLSNIQLPDLTDPDKFPEVTHGPSCTDDAPTDTRSCHPTALVRPRPYALPTEVLGRLRTDRAHRPILPPLPPSLGTHCPTIETETELAVGDAAGAETAVEHRGGDSCRPTVRNVLTMPCTRIEPEIQLEFGLPAAASWEAPVNRRDNLQCIVDLLLKIKVPGCTLFTSDPAANKVQMVNTTAEAGITRTIANTTDGNCGIKLTDIVKVPCVVPSFVPGTVLVNGVENGSAVNIEQTGPACARQVKIGLSLAVSGGASAYDPIWQVDGSAMPSLSGACTVAYGRDRVIPLRDMSGILGTAGDLLSPAEYNVVNKSDIVLTPGGRVIVTEDASQPPGAVPKNLHIIGVR